MLQNAKASVWDTRNLTNVPTIGNHCKSSNHVLGQANDGCSHDGSEYFSRDADHKGIIDWDPEFLFQPNNHDDHGFFCFPFVEAFQVWLLQPKARKSVLTRSTWIQFRKGFQAQVHVPFFFQVFFCFFLFSAFLKGSNCSMYMAKKKKIRQLIDYISQKYFKDPIREKCL